MRFGRCKSLKAQPNVATWAIIVSGHLREGDQASACAAFFPYRDRPRTAAMGRIWPVRGTVGGRPLLDAVIGGLWTERQVSAHLGPTHTMIHAVPGSR